jgi:subtilisin-like proprotein convertase family protein
MSDVGGYQMQVTDLDVSLDDEAANPISAAAPVQSGTYRPTNSGDGDQFLGVGLPSDTPSSLAVFKGAEANGTWELFIMDDNPDYSGTLNRGWEISVTTAGPAVYPSTIDVAGLPKGIADVDVTLTGLTHTYSGDVDLLLVGPGGQQATVLSDVGTEDVFDADVVLDDEAGSQLGSYVEAGRWKPTNNEGPDTFPAPAPTANGGSVLSVFDDTDPNGTWRLYAVDDRNGFRGSLAGWSLTISTDEVPATPTPTATPTTPVTPAGNPAPDVTAPSVVRTAPRGQANAVRRHAVLTATTTEAVRPATVTGRSVDLVRVGSTVHGPARLVWRAATHTILIDPSKALRRHTTYRVVVATTVRDPAGNRLDQNAAKAGRQRKAWTFTTR